MSYPFDFAQVAHWLNLAWKTLLVERGHGGWAKSKPIFLDISKEPQLKID